MAYFLVCQGTTICVRLVALTSGHSCVYWSPKREREERRERTWGQCPHILKYIISKVWWALSLNDGLVVWVGKLTDHRSVASQCCLCRAAGPLKNGFGRCQRTRFLSACPAIVWELWKNGEVKGCRQSGQLLNVACVTGTIGPNGKIIDECRGRNCRKA
jgi:hypothetical protein